MRIVGYGCEGGGGQSLGSTETDSSYGWREGGKYSIIIFDPSLTFATPRELPPQRTHRLRLPARPDTCAPLVVSLGTIHYPISPSKTVKIRSVFV